MSQDITGFLKKTNRQKQGYTLCIISLYLRIDQVFDQSAEKPSRNFLHNELENHNLREKSLSMVIFHSYVTNYQRVLQNIEQLQSIHLGGFPLE